MSSAPVRAKDPLITILGTTGTGKSELAVHLATKLNGEVINGDALQLYQGLPIVTNKITHAEQHGIRHHLLDAVTLEEPTWTVSRFVKEASRIIKDVRDRGKIPILVGGTHYYLQSMLFRDVLVQNDVSADGSELLYTQENTKETPAHSVSLLTEEELNTKWPILGADAETIRAELIRVDPIMASRWHPNDHRKIRRSLAIYLQTGRLTSEIYAEQARSRQASHGGNIVLTEQDDLIDSQNNDTLRYNNLLFWTYTQLEKLDVRLASRVDKMIERGLLHEIKQLDDFRRQQEQLGKPVELDRGIWNAIGYKEFADYLSAVQRPNSEQSQSEPQSQTTLATSRERTFIATRQYARSQIKWIKHKMLPSLQSAGIKDKLYLLDSTQLDSFATEVCAKATEIAGQWLSGEPIPDAKSISETSRAVLESMEAAQQPIERSPHICEDCGVTVMTEKDWQNHIRNSRHRRRQKRKLQDARNPYKRERRENRHSESSTTPDVEEQEDSAIGLAELEIEGLKE